MPAHHDVVDRTAGKKKRLTFMKVVLLRDACAGCLAANHQLVGRRPQDIRPPNRMWPQQADMSDVATVNARRIQKPASAGVSS